jgi:hypothetical protein
MVIEGGKSRSPWGATCHPCRPWVGPQSPEGGPSPVWWGGRQAPTRPRPGTSLQIRKKNYIKVLLPLGRATGVYFRNFSKWTYIFEILIFFKYKKEKTAERPIARRRVRKFGLEIATAAPPSWFFPLVPSARRRSGASLGACELCACTGPPTCELSK